MDEPIIPFVDRTTLSDEANAELDQLEVMFGLVHNSALTYYHRPAIAKALMGVMMALMNDPDATLPKELKGKLGIICSSVNGCRYCTSHQCQAAANPPAGDTGLTEAEITSLVDGSNEGADAVERACFRYARHASFDPASVSVAMLEEMKQDLTTGQIVELAVTVGLWKMVNTIHDTLKFPIESVMQDYSHFVDQRAVQPLGGQS